MKVNRRPAMRIALSRAVVTGSSTRVLGKSATTEMTTMTTPAETTARFPSVLSALLQLGERPVFPGDRCRGVSCAGFFLYELQPTPGSALRYCGA